MQVYLLASPDNEKSYTEDRDEAFQLVATEGYECFVVNYDDRTFGALCDSREVALAVQEVAKYEA